MKGFGQMKKMVEQQLKDMKASLAEVRVTGEAGGGLVKITLDGAYACHGVVLDEALKQEDWAMVEDLVAAAFNAAQTLAQAAHKDKMAEMGKKLGLPPGFNFPGM